MGYYKDLGTSTVAGVDKKTWLPVDEYGTLLDNTNDNGDLIDGWDQPGTELNNLTNPYGFLHFAIGSGDDFHCFDYRIFDHWLILHSTINSETGGFIMRGGYEVIDLDDPCGYDSQALEMVGWAFDWIYSEPPVRHSKKGWNQDPYYFHRCVHLSVMGWFKRHGAHGYADLTVPEFSEREKRFGGKRINKFCGVQQ